MLEYCHLQFITQQHLTVQSLERLFLPGTVIKDIFSTLPLLSEPRICYHGFLLDLLCGTCSAEPALA